MPEKTYRVGIVGCGQIARQHAKAWSAMPSCAVAAVCDVRREAAEALAGEFGVKGVYTDFRTLFAREPLDIVSVCTWAQTHAEATIAAAQARVGAVLCEKPMCYSVAEAEVMMRACDEAGTKLAIPGRFRYSPAGVRARALVEEGAIGKPYLVWTGSEAGLGNWGVYMIDLMRYVLGDPQPLWVMGSVERKTDRYERGEPIEDRCAAIICFEGGVRGVMESDTPDLPSERGWLIHGTEGDIRVTVRNTVELRNKATGGEWRRLEGIKSPDFFEETFRWFTGESGHRSDARTHRPTLEISMAIYESVRTRGLVRLPLPAEESPLRRMIADGTLPVEVPGRYDIRLDATRV